MSRIWDSALARMYLANRATAYASYRIGLGIFALYQGVTRIIFDPVALPVGILSSDLYGMLQIITAILLLATTRRYRFSRLGNAAAAMVAGVYLMLGVNIWVKGAIISGGGAVLLAFMLIFFELFANEEY